jgi:hypothetical protein
MDRRRRGIIFYRVILPGFTLVNLGLGIFTLTGLKPNGPLGWMMLGTGVLCCGIAGWLAGAPVPADSLRTLKRSLDETLVTK